ncbi:enkurin isoform X2 [Cheilinus undulatus]|uniref:enkurin isoform X2 n=1 Tax=Cheilinus undulatus TaxID=241271 RepID=UPI001BD40051|nr:enkurin isoform X2 [Cheilinus undulatus]
MSGFICPPESVYNLLPKEEPHAHKPPRYMSKFRPTVILENKSTKDAMRTMGPAKVNVPSPDKYLKKHSKEPKLTERSQCSKEVRNTCTVRKPPVPTRSDRPVMGLSSRRDFIKTAAAVPVKPPPTSVDTSKGHKQLLENSGLIPKYIKKKDYGEVPEYLQQRKEEERRAYEEYKTLVREERERAAMKKMSDETRQTILEGLKKNWDQLHQEYQGLSVIIDTMTKKAHKEHLEASMKQLETDISFLERFKTVYVPKD